MAHHHKWADRTERLSAQLRPSLNELEDTSYIPDSMLRKHGFLHTVEPAAQKAAMSNCYLPRCRPLCHCWTHCLVCQRSCSHLRGAQAEDADGWNAGVCRLRGCGVRDDLQCDWWRGDWVMCNGHPALADCGGCGQIWRGHSSVIGFDAVDRSCCELDMRAVDTPGAAANRLRVSRGVLDGVCLLPTGQCCADLPHDHRRCSV